MIAATAGSGELFFRFGLFGRQRFDDRVFSVIPAKKIDIATAIAAERKSVRLLRRLQHELLVADGAGGSADHLGERIRLLIKSTR